MSEYIAVSRNFHRGMSIMASGTRSEMQRFVRERARRGSPTHFITIMRNTVRAIERFKSQNDIGNNPRRKRRARLNCGCKKRQRRKNFGGQQYGPRRPYDQHTLRIAEETLRMDDKSAALSELFGGLSKDQARKIVHEVTGREVKGNPMRRKRRRNPKKSYIRQRIWRTSKRGAKASKRGRKKYKLKHGGRAIFAYPRGKRSSRKLYELLIPRNSRRRSKR